MRVAGQRGAAKLSAVSALDLYLASASPRRLSLLRQIGLAPRVRPARLDETVHDGESPADLVRRLAAAKGRAVARSLAAESADPVLVLAADTEVALDDEVLGKPASAEHAERMLRRLRGRSHLVQTGVFLLRSDDGRELCEIETTRVHFADFDDETLRAYVAGGEPLDKAGAYGIQGRGALLCERVEGSWSNVAGLPVERLPQWFAQIGIDLRRRIDWAPGS